MNVLIIKTVILFLLIALSSFLVGNTVCGKMKGEKSLNKSIIYGFTVLLALFEIIALPAIFLKSRFSTLITIYSIVIVVILAALLFAFIKKKQYRAYINKNYKKNILGKIFVIGFVGMQVLASTFLEHTDADDGYFVTISNIAIEQDEICLEGNSVYQGSNAVQNNFRPEVAAWELFVAYLCKIVNVHPAIMCHTMLPSILIILCYMVVCELAKKLFNDEKSVTKFIILYAVLNMFAGYSVYTAGCFLLLRIWQGKAMLVNFAFPMLMLNCIDVYKEKDNIVTWCMNFAIVCMGAMFTVVGIYLAPIYYFVVGVPYVAKLIWNRKGKMLLQTAAKAFVSMIPVIVVLLYSFFKIVTAEAGQSYMEKQAPLWIDIFRNIFGNKTMLVLLLVSMVIVYIKGSSVNKLLLTGIPVTLALTFLNPYLCEFVAQNITGVDVYWRLYWMIPMYIIISYAFVLLVDEDKSKLRPLVFVGVLIIMAHSGEFMYTEKYFTEMTNVYKIPDEIDDIANELPKDSVCMLPESLSYYLRQYTSTVNVVKARGLSGSPTLIKGTEYSESWLYSQVYANGLINEPTVAKLLEILEVDYVYYPDVTMLKDSDLNIIMIGETSGLVEIK